ncbi:MAG: 4-(cytidine 5'-diphospho)-2-C-methyl-D-erythritol kinase [Chloroflexota bacterium]
MLTVHAPAKLNLTLEVVGRQGHYHEISSILQTVSLYDTLTIESAASIQFTCSEPSLAEDNLVERTAESLKKEYAVNKGARIHLAKRIPWSAGLGGGSSDAAAVLQGLNTFWQLNLSEDLLLQTARTLGSDVPALVLGGTVHLTGTGDIVRRAPALRPTHFVLLIPDVPVPAAKTADLYAALTPEVFTNGGLTARALQSLEMDHVVPGALIYNVFEAVAPQSFPGIESYIEAFARLSQSPVHLAGSGPTLFAIASSAVDASRIANELNAAGRQAFAVQSVSCTQPGQVPWFYDMSS